jgi:hypothetical protein
MATQYSNGPDRLPKLRRVFRPRRYVSHALLISLKSWCRLWASSRKKPSNMLCQICRRLLYVVAFAFNSSDGRSSPSESPASETRSEMRNCQPEPSSESVPMASYRVVLLYGGTVQCIAAQLTAVMPLTFANVSMSTNDQILIATAGQSAKKLQSVTQLLKPQSSDAVAIETLRRRQKSTSLYYLCCRSCLSQCTATTSQNALEVCCCCCLAAGYCPCPISVLSNLL